MLNKLLDWDGVGIRRWEWARVSCRWPSRGGTGVPPVLRLRGLGAGVVPVALTSGTLVNRIFGAVPVWEGTHPTATVRPLTLRNVCIIDEFSTPAIFSMPKKIREIKSMLLKAGFTYRPGKGSHTKWYHPLLPGTLTLSGKDGSDAKPYQEMDVSSAIQKLEEIQRQLGGQEEGQE